MESRARALAFAVVCGCGASRSVRDGGGGDGDAAPDAGDCVDADGDGHGDVACGGDDCNDADARIHPGAPDGELVAYWTMETIHEDGSPMAALAIDAAGTAHLGCEIATADPRLQYGTYSDPLEGWTFAPVDVGTSDRIEIALDGGGAAHLAYTVFSEIRHAAAPGWAPEHAADGVGPGGLAVAADGAAHVCFQTSGIPSDLGYATNASGAWQPTVLGRVLAGKDWSEFSCAVALDAGGRANIVYASGAEGSVRHSVEAGGGEFSDSLVTDVNGEYVSMAIGADGMVHAAYAAEFDLQRPLVHSSLVGGAWTHETVDRMPDLAATSIATDADGRVHVAYVGAGLRYASNASGVWDVEGIDPDGRLVASLALDRDGLAWIVYFREGEGLRLARRRLAPNGIDEDCDGAEG